MINFILKNSKYVIIIILLLTIPFGYFLQKQKFFNHIDIYFDKDDKDLIRYKKFQEVYGNEELVVLAFKDKNIFTNEKIDIIRNISNELDELKGIQRVYSLTFAEEAIGEGDSVDFKKIIPNGHLSKKQLKNIKNKILANKVIVNGLISKDGNTNLILIEVEPQKDAIEKSKLLRKIETLSRKHSKGKVDIRFSGSSLAENELNRLSQKDTFIFTPLALLIVLIIVTNILKKFSFSVVILINLIFIAIWIIGFQTFCGETMNMVNVIVLPVVLAIAVADGIHLLSHLKELSISNNVPIFDNIRSSVKAVWLPCLFTTLTTGIGFFSFITSSIRPVKIVGIFTSIGVVIALFMTITFIPTFIIIFKKRFSFNYDKHTVLNKKPDNKKNYTESILNYITTFTVNNYVKISIAFVLITVLSVIGISKIKFETNFANYLPETNQLKKDINFIQDNMGGTVPFILLIKAKDTANDFNNPESLRMLSKIQDYVVGSIEQYTSSFSIADYIMEVNRAFNDGKEKSYKIPDSSIDVRDYFEIGDTELQDRMMSPNRMEARISIQSLFISNEVAMKNTDLIMNYLKKNIGDKFTFKRTGLNTLYLTMGVNLKSSQIKSFLFALFFIFIMMFFVCRNIKLSIISMIPNLFPIFITLGIMGWFGIPLDVSTIMIASIVLGIAVDDTIHFIIWIRRGILSEGDIKEAIIKTVNNVGKPIVFTTVILVLVFFSLILGSIKPIRAFGVLTAFSMIFALIGDLIVLPAILLIFKPKLSSGKTVFNRNHK